MKSRFIGFLFIALILFVPKRPALNQDSNTPNPFKTIEKVEGNKTKKLFLVTLKDSSPV